MPGVKPQTVEFAVPGPGFYCVKANVSVGGIAEISGSDAPVAFGTSGKLPLFTPRCKLFFEMQDADAPAALVVVGGGPNEMVRARLSAPSGAVVWEKDGVGAVHRFQFARPRETGLWELSLDRASDGTFEDASASVVGIPESRFPCREKRWSWMAR